MPRPQVTHDGFLIPNASDVTNPRMAEPDRIDFNTIAQGLWGVIEGCEVTVAGTSASTLGGWVVINNLLYQLNPGPVSLGGGGDQDRFDLVVATTSGTLGKVVGTQAVDPVFPDPPLNVTVLAAVFCPAGSSALVDNVIDKRRFVPKKLLTKIPTNENLIRNLNGDDTGDIYHVLGSGEHEWQNDTRMWRSASETLRIHKYLDVTEKITTRNIDLDGALHAGGAITGSNLIMGNGNPPDTGHKGAIYQNWDNGLIYVRRAGEWEEIATIKHTVPVGTVLMSLEPPSVMTDLGWVEFGSVINEEPKYTKLFQVAALQRYIHAGSPRTMHLPSAAGYVIMGGGPGFASGNIGVLGEPHADNKITLLLRHMPKHGHDPRTQPAGAASPRATTDRRGMHSHAVTGGAHDHAINDPGHAHHGMDLNGSPQAVICKIYGAENKLDALFNDSNHTHAVDYLWWTMKNTTNINILRAGSDHGHALEANGDHIHAVDVTDIPAHNHTIVETDRGGDDPFDITPKYLTVRVYVRS